MFVIANSLAEKNKAASSDFNCRVMECRLATQVRPDAIWHTETSITLPSIAAAISLDARTQNTNNVQIMTNNDVIIRFQMMTYAMMTWRNFTTAYIVSAVSPHSLCRRTGL